MDRFRCIVSILILVVWQPIFALATPQKEIGLGGVHAETSFPAFNRLIEQGWGREVVVHALQEQLPHMEISQSGSARYFGAIMVPTAEYWQTSFKYPATRKLLLVKVYVRLFIFDVERQEEVVRETFSACDAVPFGKGKEESLVPLKNAFQHCIGLAVQKLAQKLPLRGLVREADSRFGTVLVDLGEHHGVRKGSRLEILNSKGESLGKFEVTKLQAEECRAEPEGANPGVEKNFVARLITESPAVPSKQDVLRKAVEEDFVGATELPITPNPVVAIRITNPQDHYKTYLGREPGVLPLQAQGVDAWGDAITLSGKLIWEVTRGDKGLIPPESARFLPKQPGTFEVKAFYPIPDGKTIESPAITIHVIQLKKLTIAPKDLVLSPQEGFRFTVTGEDSEKNLLTAADLQEQLVWQILPAAIAKADDNGLVTAMAQAGRARLRVADRNTPNVYDEARLLVLPPVQLKIKDAKGKEVTGQKVTLASGDSAIWECEIVCDIAGVDVAKIPVKWQVEQANAGDAKPDNRRLFFRAGSQESSIPFDVTVRIANVPEESTRRDIRAKILVEIEQLWVQVTSQKFQNELYPGQTMSFGAKAFLGSQELEHTGFTWSLTPTSAQVRIDQTGLLSVETQGAEGEYEICATENRIQKAGKLKIRVIPEAVASLTIDAPKTLESGVTYPLSAMVKNKDGNKLYNRKIEWRVAGGNSQVAGDGLFQAGDAGYVRVYAKTGDVEENVLIEITKRQGIRRDDHKEASGIGHIEVYNEEKRQEIAPGAKIQFLARVVGKDERLLLGMPLEWTVSDDGHKLDQRDGFFTAGSKLGAVDIKATEPKSKVSGIFRLAVRWPEVGRIELNIGGVNSVTLSAGQRAPVAYAVFDKQGRKLEGYQPKWAVNGGRVDMATREFVAPEQPGSYQLRAVDPIGTATSNPVTLVVIERKTSPQRQQQRFTMLQIDSRRQELTTGEEITLKARAFDGNEQRWSEDVPVRWSIVTSGSSHKLDQHGAFRAGNTPGKVMILAELTPDKGNQRLTAKIEISVKQLAARIQIAPAQITLAPGKSQYFSATVYDTQGQTMSVPVTWKTTGGGTLRPAMGNTCMFIAKGETGRYEITATINNQVTGRAAVQVVSTKVELVMYERLGLSYKLPSRWRETHDKSATQQLDAYLYVANEQETAGLMLAAMSMAEGISLPSFSQLGDEFVEQLLSGIEPVIMGESFPEGKYKRTRADNATFGVLTGKMLYYLVEQPNREPSSVRTFVSFHGNKMYLIMCMAFAKEWETYWPLFETSLQSLSPAKSTEQRKEPTPSQTNWQDQTSQTTHELPGSRNWKKVTEASYRMTYRVMSDWQAKPLDTGTSERVVQYWKNDRALIQFDFWPAQVYTLDQWIPTVERNLFGAWAIASSRTSLTDKTIHGIEGKLITYALTYANGSLGYAENFYAIDNETFCLIYYACLAQELTQHQADFRKSMNSVKIGEDDESD